MSRHSADGFAVLPLCLFFSQTLIRAKLFPLVSLSCGGSASENCTYLVQSSVTSLTSPCTYKICPCNTNICRMRFDFQVRQLKGYLLDALWNNIFVVMHRFHIGWCARLQKLECRFKSNCLNKINKSSMLKLVSVALSNNIQLFLEVIETLIKYGTNVL